MKRIWMVAAENGAFRGGKVGGIADVIRDLPRALAGCGHQVTVITPAYGVFNTLADARHLADIRVQFGGKEHRAEVFQVSPAGSVVEFIVIEHPLISSQRVGAIYHHDGSDAPYATDATRFAFFCAAMAAFIEHNDTQPDVLHLHDWHTGLIPALRQFDPSLKKLGRIRTVYTIHNLAFQGIRPFEGHASAFESWFPHLRYRRELLADPRYSDCVNPMAIAIRLADKLNTVSPTYAGEILQPNDPKTGFNGGEGLEADLRSAAASNRLTGILNGCFYPGPGGRRPGWSRLRAAITAERHLLRGNPVAQQNLRHLPARRPPKLLVSIGRIGAQKVSLLLQPTSKHASALEGILQKHGRSLVFIMLGSGDKDLEDRLDKIASRQRNFLLLKGYSETLPDLLYPAGDLFIMPSSFEPCGISQMLAMRAGQPCAAHAVGGLKDTVTDGVNGFTFTGETPGDQAGNFVDCVNRALKIKTGEGERWKIICNNASAMRFSWTAAAESYVSELYESSG